MPNEARSVFGDYNLPHKDWLTYINKTDRTSELCYNLSISHQGFIQTILMSAKRHKKTNLLIEFSNSIFIKFCFKTDFVQNTLVY